MNRRALVGGLTAELLAAPRITAAQAPNRVYRPGIITINPRSAPFVNLKAAKALSLTVPPSILVRADR